MRCSVERKLVLVAALVPALLVVAGHGVLGGQPATGKSGDSGSVQIAKAVLDTATAGKNLLRPDRWQPWGKGFQRQGQVFVCDNGADTAAQRGVSQTVVLNQRQPEPIVATAWSKAEGVTGSPNNNYALYLDLQFTDGTPLWGQTAQFDTGTHQWQQRRVVIVPDKPVRQVSFHMLLRGHGGKAWFRDPELRVVHVPQTATLFDGVPVVPKGRPREGFQLRDVAAESPFVYIEREALGIRLEYRRQVQGKATFFDVTVSDTTGSDRAITLLYSVPVESAGLTWLHDPRTATPVEPGREHIWASHFRVGANGRLSRYPFGAVANSSRGVALGIDMARPAYFRIAYNTTSGELFLAYDIGLTPEKPSARVRFCRFEFDPQWGFRAALARYYELFPQAFVCRVKEQGLWMPFARISKVEGWEDFGFRIKEGNNETAWDDAHGILTFRYTEPMTWWMRMGTDLPRTMEAALAEAERLVREGHRSALAWKTSGFHNEQGRFAARLLDTPWCNGAVWSMNSMPGIAGEVTDFKNKWNEQIRQQLYGPQRKGDLDGEYVDSSEGYVTDELDFRRDHFPAADTPLCYSLYSRRPGIFRGLIAFEYVRGIARDVRRMDKLMMANGAPGRLCWLAPMLDVLGTETNWNPGGHWRPMSDAEMLYRRSLCRGKPFCFLMNTRFEQFPPELVERYMKRALAYGMFPGFFSHNASQGHYFTRPELYNRDRPLFKKYVPLCKLVAEAGWEPVTLATTNHPRVYVERFGRRYLTVLNDDDRPHAVTVRAAFDPPGQCRELVSGKVLTWHDRQVELSLNAEHVAVLDLGERALGP